MKISKNTVVTLRYSVYDAQGSALEEGVHHHVTYLHGGYDEIFPRVEEALNGKGAGEKIRLQLEPEDAFGEYDAQQLRVEPRSRFPEPLEIGMQFEGVPAEANEIQADSETETETEIDTNEEGIIYTVTDLVDGHVVLDGNHPFAGMALRFDLEVLVVRAAEPEEIALEHAIVETDDDEESDEAAELEAQLAAKLGGQTLH